jgi:glycosyltransferase involved in cell wall biosynthesis
MKPLFSVIIPAFNEEKFLPQLLESLTHQTEMNFETIVVDGKSKDKTVAVANSYKKKLPQLKVIVSDKACLPYQRNLGAKNSTGEWLLFFDADGIFLPYAIDRCTQYIKTHPTNKFFTTWFAPDSEVSGDATLILLSSIFIETGSIVKRQIAPGSFAAIRREVFESIGGYDESRGYGEDQEISMRLFEKGILLGFLRETIYIYSLRRFRRQGTLRMVQTYAKNAFIALLTKRAPAQEKGYIMGGQLYEKPKTIKKSSFRKYEKRLKIFIQEMFELDRKHT